MIPENRLPNSQFPWILYHSTRLDKTKKFLRVYETPSLNRKKLARKNRNFTCANAMFPGNPYPNTVSSKTELGFEFPAQNDPYVPNFSNFYRFSKIWLRFAGKLALPKLFFEKYFFKGLSFARVSQNLAHGGFWIWRIRIRWNFLKISSLTPLTPRISKKFKTFFWTPRPRNKNLKFLHKVYYYSISIVQKFQNFWPTHFREKNRNVNLGKKPKGLASENFHGEIFFSKNSQIL